MSGHVISYLQPGRYTRVDSRPSFVETARQVVAMQGLAARSQSICSLANFHFQNMNATFSWSLCLSALSQGLEADGRGFFERMHRVMHDTTGWW